MSRFDQWLKAARKDYALDFGQQSCFNLTIITRSEFDKLCATTAPCDTCALCNNVGFDYKELLELLEIPDE